MEVTNQGKGGVALITGGLGFIGSNLALTLLDLGWRVVVVDSLRTGLGGNAFNLAPSTEGLRVVIADIANRVEVQTAISEASVIFNLSGHIGHLDSMEDPQLDLELNVTSQLKFLYLVRELNPSARIVFTSTRQIYGRPQCLPVTEAHPLKPVDVNGVHKITGELYHELFHNVFGTKITILRLTNTYGPRMKVSSDSQNLMGVWIRKSLQGERIAVFGDGLQMRDFTFVTDVCDALVKVIATNSSIGKIYNVGGLKNYSLLEVAEVFARVSKEGRGYHLVPFPSDREEIDIGNFYADHSRLSADTGWAPTVDLETGISQTLAFYSQNRSLYGI